MGKKKQKVLKPRDWSVVHLINRGGAGSHDKTEKRSKTKQDLNNKIKQGKLEDI